MQRNRRFAFNKHSILLCLLTFSLLTLSSCGFHLRGDYLIAPELQTLSIRSTDRFGELTRVVKRHLIQHNIKIVENSQEDIAQLVILKDTLDRRTLSVFPNGQVAEYELTYTVHYQIKVKDKQPQSFKFEVNRDYQDDPDAALAKSRELSLMLREMRQEAADRILRNMASIEV
ncbi:LPS-assembly lipoprotein LptE [Thalassotalea fusca]